MFRLFTDFPRCFYSRFLTPCQYATGEEYRVCKGFDGVDRVYRPKDMNGLFINDNTQSGVVFYGALIPCTLNDFH